MAPHRWECYLGFGGGGFGTPVVSYAPLPILQDWVSSLVTILRRCVEVLGSLDGKKRGTGQRGSFACVCVLPINIYICSPDRDRCIPI